MNVDRDGIAAADAAIGAHIRRTPTVDLDGVTLKLESVQHAGSFKVRGAFASLLLRQVTPAGVVAASGGNHGAAVAYAARALGRRAKIFVPTYASPAKVQRIRDYGADLVLRDSIAEVFAGAEEWAASTGAVYVHPFDQVETMCGAGTVGMELERQAPDLDTVLVAVGGGGLIAGIGAWYAGGVRVIGVEPETAATLYRAFEAGQPVNVAGSGYAMDSLAPPRVGERVYPIARRYVERVVLVTDDAIREAQRRLWDAARIVAEAGGSAGLAALVSGRYVPAAGERVGVVVWGEHDRGELSMIERRHVGPRMSQVVVHDGTIYVAGQVAVDTTADVVGQTRQILHSIDALLDEVGSDKTKLLSANVWLADVADYDAVNTVWDAWVVPGHTPAQACVGSPLAGPQYRIEIACIAAQ